MKDIIKNAKKIKDKTLTTAGLIAGSAALVGGVEIGERSRKNQLPIANKDIRDVYDPIRGKGEFAIDAFNY